MKNFVTILALFSLLTGCAMLGQTYEATIEGYVNSPTGEYLVIKANQMTVQDIWESVAPKDRCHLKVEAFTDWKKKQIWYWTKHGLKQELYNIKSYRNMMEAAGRDRKEANPLCLPSYELRRVR